MSPIKLLWKSSQTKLTFLNSLGFDIVVYLQSCWRRGRDICVIPLANYTEMFDDTDAEIFIINTKIADTTEREPRKSGSCHCGGYSSD